MQIKTLFLIILIFAVGACAPNTSYVHIIPTEERMVQDCQYLGTLAENSDPGRLLPNYRVKDAQQDVLHQADRIGATHIVWLYDYRIGSAAQAYRCDK